MAESKGKGNFKKGRSGKKIIPQGIFEVYTDARRKQKLYTKSLLGTRLSEFGERCVKERDGVYREWDAKRSKLAAFITNGCVNTGIRSGSVVLYLGASHGHTPTYVSDMVGPDGFVFALDFAPRVVRDLGFIWGNRWLQFWPMLCTQKLTLTVYVKLIWFSWIFHSANRQKYFCVTLGCF